MSWFVICTVHLLRSGLNNEDGIQSAPLTETLYCTSTRRERGNPKTENKRGMLMRRACARTLSPRSFLLLGLAAHTQPALRTGLMALAWRLLHVSQRAILGLMATITVPGCTSAGQDPTSGTPRSVRSPSPLKVVTRRLPAMRASLYIRAESALLADPLRHTVISAARAGLSK